MPRRKYRQFTATEKVAILREHLLEKKPISEVCAAHELQPSVFYDWQRKFFENGPAAFKDQKDREKERLQAKVDQLQKKLDHKDSVIAAVTEEFVRVKKSLGSPESVMGSPRHTRQHHRLRQPLERADPAPTGPLCPLDRSLPGRSGTVRSTSTTPGFPETTGYKTGRRRRSATSPRNTLEKDTGV